MDMTRHYNDYSSANDCRIWWLNLPTDNMPSSFSLDPRTAIVIATLMMLLNGGMLGMMHRELAEDVRPSAMNWGVGTLLQAVAAVLLSVQNSPPASFVIPLANAAVLLSLFSYLRSVCLFFNQALSSLFLWIVIATIAGVYWFTAFVRTSVPDWSSCLWRWQFYCLPVRAVCKLFHKSRRRLVARYWP